MSQALRYSEELAMHATLSNHTIQSYTRKINKQLYVDLSSVTAQEDSPCSSAILQFPTLQSWKLQSWPKEICNLFSHFNPRFPGGTRSMKKRSARPSMMPLGPFTDAPSSCCRLQRTAYCCRPFNGHHQQTPLPSLLSFWSNRESGIAKFDSEKWSEVSVNGGMLGKSSQQIRQYLWR